MEIPKILDPDRLVRRSSVAGGRFSSRLTCPDELVDAFEPISLSDPRRVKMPVRKRCTQGNRAVGLATLERDG